MEHVRHVVQYDESFFRNDIDCPVWSMKVDPESHVVIVHFLPDLYERRREIHALASCLESALHGLAIHPEE